MEPRAPSSSSAKAATSCASSSGGSPPPASLSPCSACNGHSGSITSSSPAREGASAPGDSTQDIGKVAAEGERHPKGKRKRTQAKDKQILEEEYQKNSKPDKAARLEIVKRVSLTEKEIWFQNRRQNDRRRTRTYSAEEVEAMTGGRIRLLASQPITPNTVLGLNDMNSIQYTPAQEHGATTSLASDPASSQSRDEPGKAQGVSHEATLVGHGHVEREPRRLSEPWQPRSQFFSGSVGYLSNRWNAPNSSFTSAPSSHLVRSHSFSSALPPATAPSLVPSPPNPLRLSTSIDGKAEVVPANASPAHPNVAPPSPGTLHRQGPGRRLDFRRSHSTTSLPLPPISTLTRSLSPAPTGPLPPRLTRGRSRDVNAWEYCCGSENTEDLLTMQAQHESSGSAAAAIHLIRSTSSPGGIPPPLSAGTKRNAAVTRTARRADPAKKPRLSTQASSLGRMETTVFSRGQRHNIKRPVAPATQLDKPKTTSHAPLLLSGNDSDKENWDPEEDATSPRAFRRLSPYRPRLPTNANNRRPLPTSPSRRRMLHHDKSRSPHRFLSRASTMPAARGRGRSPPLRIFEDADDKSVASGGSQGSGPEEEGVDDEVERFMRGAVISPSKKGDADAAASLLSLCRGKWR
ncbi:uncharacterized protein B0T15DRAFT_5571 [Chaetomium strumarium]|uniref:Homeobox domain-containing protein n=1 Tax=Chaetomium strumarium TaxID=1170767 RepID=A0AAJ0H108_9PEZI|nr:hypothetical protein B0T15DRAFT_5571 [Chaetomium strumarium]